MPIDHFKYLLTKPQIRALHRYEQMLEMVGLSAKTTLDRAKDDPEAIVPVLEIMTNQIVRSEIVMEYTWIDEDLGFVLTEHFFGKGNRLKTPSRSKRLRTFQLILQRLYLGQKLELIQTYKKIPKEIANKMRALNDLRNGIAHNFFLDRLPKTRRTYKGINVFTPKGFQIFHDDMWEIRFFFHPWMRNIIGRADSKEG